MQAQDFLHNQRLQLLLIGDYIYPKECWCYLLEINGSGVCGEKYEELGGIHGWYGCEDA